MITNSEPSEGVPRDPGALVVYESMFGNSRLIAEAIAAGLNARCQSIHTVSGPEVESAFLLVVGAPTHVHGLIRPATRAEARHMAEQSTHGEKLDVEARGDGIREWMEQLVAGPRFFAAFDTRVDAPKLFSGSAASNIARHFDRLHSQELLSSESFLVDKANRLLDGELDRAREWGRALWAAADTADVILEMTGVRSSENAAVTFGTAARARAGELLNRGGFASIETKD